MGVKNNLKDSIQILAGTYNKDRVDFIICEVVSVSAEDRTCVVTPIQGESESQIEDVKISAEDSDGFILFPSVGSTVLASLSTIGDAYVLMFSDVDSIQLKNDTYGGLVKVKELNDNLNSIKNYCTAMAQAVQDALTAVGVGTAASGPSGATNFAASMASKAIEIKDMESDSVKHG